MILFSSRLQFISSCFQINIDIISCDEDDVGPFPKIRNSSCTDTRSTCDFNIKSTRDFDVQSIYSEVIENGPKR